MRLFAGDDWAEDHHDVELMDEHGRVLARGRLPEGVAGMARLHELIGEQLGEGADDAEVVIDSGNGLQQAALTWAAAWSSSEAAQRLASADPAGSSSQISRDPLHTAEAGRRRLPGRACPV
jgi:Transposase